MKVLADGRWMFPATRGMGKFAHMMLAPLVNSGVLSVLAPSKSECQYGYNCVFSAIKPYPVWEQYVLRRVARKIKADYVLCPYNTAPVNWKESGTLIIAIHDLIYLHPVQNMSLSESMYQRLGRHYRQYVVPRVITPEVRVLTVSNTTKDQLVEEFGLTESQVYVIPNSLSEGWLISPPELQQRDPSIYLTVTGDAPHKNCTALIRAFAIASKILGSHAKLWIVGIPKKRQSSWKRLAQNCGALNEIVFFDTLSTRELMQLYDTAGSMLFPSLAEGFGIPLIEAMARALPIAASARKFATEIAGNAALFFDPEDIESMASSIIRVGDDQILRERLVLNSKQRVSRFTLGEVTQQISNFWNDIGVL